VADFNQTVEAEKAGAALNGVEAAENGIQQVNIFGTLLELDQFFIQPFKYLACFDQKVLQNLIVGVNTHHSFP
jgi:hypothetical protein